MSSMKIAIAATFTAEPLAESLNFWSEKLRWQASVAFAPYNQVFQQLLDPTSLLSTNAEGINVILVRPEDWQRYERGSAPQEQSALVEKVKRNAQDFVQAVRAAAERSATPYLVYFCPASPAASTDPLFLRVEEQMCSQLEDIQRIYLLRNEELASYQVISCYDARGDEMAHLPYTTEFFAVLGMVVARKIHALKQAPYKVIVVDCDETLWRGVCGEVGAIGVEIDPGRKSLQEFLVRQHDAGMLLCLCSKNNEDDVDEVFHRRKEMPLKREHIFASRVNWRSKPQNLRELASELQLGLDSLVFIDDNPLACEQVRSSCPDVLTLQLPDASEKIPQFLQNVWAFDKQKVTEEDRERTAFYRENRERDRFRQEAPTLESFLAGLQLKIDLDALMPERLPRVSQLTQRTNQFNCTTRRRSEDQIRQPWSAGELECLTVTVSDRFGDYGLVGAMMYRPTADALAVDTFLLSCRVLGRGIEHNMLRRLGEVALSRGLPRVDIQFIPSKKNSPALSFLEGMAGQFKETAEGGYCLRVPAEYAAGLSENQVLATSQVAVNAVREQEQAVAAHVPLAAPSEVMQEIATRFGDSESIVRCMLQHLKSSAAGQQTARFARLPNEVEQAIVEAWTGVLGTSEISSEDDFFALGGDSLPAVKQILPLIQLFGISLGLQDIFDNRTVASLARVIESALHQKQPPSDLNLGSQAARTETEETERRPETRDASMFLASPTARLKN